MQVSSSNMIPIKNEHFEEIDGTTVHWLGSAGVLINSNGTTILIDPVLDEVAIDGEYWTRAGGLKLFHRVPIQLEKIPKVDAILYTHADEDHIGYRSYQILAGTGAKMYCPGYVKEVFRSNGVSVTNIETVKSYSEFQIKDITVTCTKAIHPWQEKLAGGHYVYQEEDCVGFMLHTKDGVIWHPGDTVLLDEHFHYSKIDLLLIDFSDDPYHFGTQQAIQLANYYKKAKLIAIHWGTYECNKSAMNGNPYAVKSSIEQQERLIITPIGEIYRLNN